MYSDPNDADLGFGTEGGLRPAKKKVIRRKKDNDETAESPVPADAPSAVPPPAHDERTQIVETEAEANALVTRIRQLEGENAALSHSLATICEQNASLTSQIDSLCDKVAQLSSTPWKGASVLHSLFEPEKTGWFGGSKSAARDQLEKMSEALQAEFMEYKMSHATTNDEVQALMTALKGAEVNAATLAKQVDDQQKQLSSGQFNAVIRIVPAGGSAGADGAANSGLADELRRQQALVRSLRSELDAARAASNTSATTTSGADAATIENLRREVTQLRQALDTETAMHEHKKQENATLERQLSDRQADLASVRSQLVASSDASARSTNSAGELQRAREELRQAKAESESVRRDLEAAQKKMLEASNTYEKKYAAVEARLVESQSVVSQKDAALSRTVPAEQFSKLDLEKNALEQELSLCKNRIKYLEEKQAKDAAKDGGARSLDDTVNATMVLETLDKNKERIARLEFEASQLQLQLQQAQAYAVTRDEDARRLERSTAEDKQRVSFLLKKCAAVTADTRAVTATRDQLADQLEKAQTENKKLRRQLEDIPPLRTELDATKKEKQQLEARLSSVQELEDHLVKAKETIAYMELAQTRSINMSQYAELQTAKDKLENTMEPLKRKLDEANKEIERLKSVTDAQQAVTAHQKNNVQDWQERMDSLTASEAKLREKVTTLTAENDRLQQLNASLELQMTNMQDGIKEMAVQMERERSTARQSATASSEKELADLRLKLEQANGVLARMETDKAGVVAEPLYKSVTAERDSLSEDLKKKSVDLEKLKSEILIYRQTIDELEAENDENVKKIESLQDKYQAERSVLTERLSAEQNRAADLAVDLETAHEELAKKDDLLKDRDEAIRQLEERNRVQQRAYEDKCRAADQGRAPTTAASSAASSPRSSMIGRDGTANGTFPDSANQSITTDNHAMAPVLNTVAVPSAAATAAAEADAAASNARLYQLQCENDRLRGDLKRLQLRYKTDCDEDQRMIGMLQAQVRSRLPASDRTAYEAEISRSAALKKSNAALMDENESLRKALDFSTSGAHGGAAAALSPSALSPTSAGNAVAVSEAQVKVIELQKKLAEQSAQLEAQRARVAELEQQQHQQTGDEHGGDDDDGADDDEKDSSPLDNMERDKPHKKKVKKVRKKKTLSEQVAGIDPLAAMMTGDGADGERGIAGDASGMVLGSSSGADAQLGALQAEKARLAQEVDALRKENAKLKTSIAELQEELQNALDDFDTAQADMTNEREDLQQQIRRLQTDSRQSSSAFQALSQNNSMVGSSSFGGKESFVHQNMRDLESQLRSMKDENERLQEEIRKVKNTSLKHERHVSAHAVNVEASQETIRQLEAEIDVLKQQLVPTKQKLAEYMALADRLGLQYPFPPELEGATVLRLKALHIDASRAMSAPPQTARRSRTPAAAAASAASPPPRPPHRAGGRAASRPEPTEDFSLR